MFECDHSPLILLRDYVIFLYDSLFDLYDFIILLNVS